MEQIINKPIGETKTGMRSPKLPIQGAIFDLDGVLTDTSELHYLAWKRLADEESITFSRKENEDLRGISRRESLLKLLKGRQISENQLEEMMERKNRYYIDFISKLTEKDLLPGARDLLISLRTIGIKTAVGSSSKNARIVIQKLKIADLLDEIADGTSVINPKPAPDLFLFAARQMKIPASNCIVFEDAKAGIEAALAGGMWAIGIGSLIRLEGAHLNFQNLGDFPVKKMTDLLTRVTYI